MANIVKIAVIGKPVIEVALEDNASIRDAFAAAGVDTSGSSPMYNNQIVDLSDPAPQGGMLMLTKSATSA